MYKVSTRLFIYVTIFAALHTVMVKSTWWTLSQLPLQALSVVDTGVICDNIPGLIQKQRKLCQLNRDVMVSMIKGMRLGVKECQRQFIGNRWNCSTSNKDASVFGKMMLKGSREAAFVYAIWNAGVVHSITRDCSKGALIHCACDPTKKGLGVDRVGETFNWGGCSDNVHYGIQFGRMFLDARERRTKDARALMNLHNNRAGRRAAKKFMRLECKCHGVSGSCTVRTCWQAMESFKVVGSYLRKRYNGAHLMTLKQDGSGLGAASLRHKRPSKNDLLYLEASPDYCVQDSLAGTLGTANRQCNKTSLSTDGCDIMCCGRGYLTRTEQRVEKCNCKFYWCCSVKCQECIQTVDVHYCKGTTDIPTNNIYENILEGIQP